MSSDFAARMAAARAAKGKGGSLKSRHKKGKKRPPATGDKKKTLAMFGGGPLGQNTQQGDTDPEPDPSDPMEAQENAAGEP